MIKLIAVLNKKRAIGTIRDGKPDLLYKDLHTDLARFRRLTKGQPVIMGPTTYASLPDGARPLPGRPNFVVSRTPGYTAEGATVVGTIEEAIARAKVLAGDGDVWVIGGAMIYSLARQYADELFLTLVDDETEGEPHFFDYEDEFSEIVPNEDEADNGVHEENGKRFIYQTRARPSSTS